MIYLLFQPLVEWTSSNVVDLLTSLNLYRYVNIFKKGNIKGTDLVKLDRDILEVRTFFKQSVNENDKWYTAVFNAQVTNFNCTF